MIPTTGGALFARRYRSCLLQ